MRTLARRPRLQVRRHAPIMSASRGTRMQIVIGHVLSADEIATVHAALARARFVDGKATAGFAARTVKNNRQAEGSDRALATIRKLVAERILGNEVFRLAVRPKALSPLLFSRYERGRSEEHTSEL